MGRLQIVLFSGYILTSFGTDLFDLRLEKDERERNAEKLHELIAAQDWDSYQMFQINVDTDKNGPIV